MDEISLGRRIAKARWESGLTQEECGLVRAYGIEIKQHAVVAGQKAGYHGSSGRYAQGAGGEGIGHHRALPGDPVQVRRADQPVAGVPL